MAAITALPQHNRAKLAATHQQAISRHILQIKHCSGCVQISVGGRPCMQSIPSSTSLVCHQAGLAHSKLCMHTSLIRVQQHTADTRHKPGAKRLVAALSKLKLQAQVITYIRLRKAQICCAAVEHPCDAALAALQHQQPLAVQLFNTVMVHVQASTSQTAAETAPPGCHVNVQLHQHRCYGSDNWVCQCAGLSLATLMQQLPSAPQMLTQKQLLNSCT